jgi:ribosomal protein L7/L12
MRRELTDGEHENIVKAIVAGDRVEATNIYISATECGLTEAQTFIKTLTAEVKSNRLEKQTAKDERKRGLWHGLFASSKE